MRKAREAPKGRKEERCPHCGLLIVWNYDEQRVHHELPVCKPYLDAVNASGLKSRGHTTKP